MISKILYLIVIDIFIQKDQWLAVEFIFLYVNMNRHPAAWINAKSFHWSFFLFPPGQSDTGAEKHTHRADDKTAL